jgi:hypothetical protein
MRIIDAPGQQGERRNGAARETNLPRSLLDAFCRAHGIGTPQLAEAAHVSRQHLNRARAGRTDVRIGIAKAIASGASALCGRSVEVGELFDLTTPRRRESKPMSGEASLDREPESSGLRWRKARQKDGKTGKRR